MQNTTGRLTERIRAGKVARHQKDRTKTPPIQQLCRAGASAVESEALFPYEIYEGLSRKEQTQAMVADIEDALKKKKKKGKMREAVLSTHRTRTI